MKHKHNQATTEGKGFTIIEVVLVLAIAGLIFLMVFIALPALQRSQRDTQRKDDLSRLQTAVTRYSSNNRGKLPSSFDSAFINSYLKTAGDTFTDPNGVDYTIQTLPNGATGLSAYSSNAAPIIYDIGGTCGDDGAVTVASSASRKVTFRIALEGGGVACVNN